ncbi:hypothetical protein CYMTET_54309 [Cymbomonas tetramitiformis]|uniref:Uncharacterized protein n=1 Tax=Cymbomonas tetramitiformis TaxID=36881 RepID=A0AAE0ENV1_9CHLO|nr:hypothetical protein CYMTET_54309 [Cymbomonas tetramitiformis]
MLTREVSSWSNLQSLETYSLRYSSRRSEQDLLSLASESFPSKPSPSSPTLYSTHVGPTALGSCPSSSRTLPRHSSEVSLSSTYSEDETHSEHSLVALVHTRSSQDLVGALEDCDKYGAQCGRCVWEAVQLNGSTTDGWIVDDAVQLVKLACAR